MGYCRGIYCCLGGLTGSPWSQIVDMGPLVRDGVGWMGWVGMGVVFLLLHPSRKGHWTIGGVGGSGEREQAYLTFWIYLVL